MERKPKIRKALFIGLGGTGAMSLIELKKKFKEVYGHVDADKASLPEFVKFMSSTPMSKARSKRAGAKPSMP